MFYLVALMLWLAALVSGARQELKHLGMAAAIASVTTFWVWMATLVLDVLPWHLALPLVYGLATLAMLPSYASLLVLAGASQGSVRPLPPESE